MTGVCTFCILLHLYPSSDTYWRKGLQGHLNTLEVGQLHHLLYFIQDRLLAAADDKLPLMCGNGAECTTAEASPMDVDGELYHIICGNPLSFVFRMGKAGIGQIVRMVKLFLAHRRIRRIDNDHFIIYLLCDTGSRIFIGFFFDVPEIAGLFLLSARHSSCE